ncbi:ABC transporter ATP-binding protein [Flindersiella endophytica]
MTVIEVTDLVKQYGDKRAVDSVSLAVEEGEIFGILGPNGAGKTTMVECIAGLRTQDSGTISVLGMDPRRDREVLHEQVGVQLQESELFDQIKVWEALDLYASFYNSPVDYDKLIVDLGLAEKRNSTYRKLSGGQKQRLSIALALVGNPRIAILDELTTGLDPQARRDTWQVIEDIRDRGVTVLLVTHFMEEAERLCDRLALIDRGKVVALDSPAGLIERINAEQRLRFRRPEGFDEQQLTGLPGVEDVKLAGRTVVVSGTGNLVHTVTSFLARHQIVAQELRVEQANLDDAFIQLTGRTIDA